MISDQLQTPPPFTSMLITTSAGFVAAPSRQELWHRIRSCATAAAACVFGFCRGKYAMSLLSAPITSPLHAVELGLAQHPAFAGHNKNNPGHAERAMAPAGFEGDDTTPADVLVHRHA
jgi:hypothetical protein